MIRKTIKIRNDLNVRLLRLNISLPMKTESQIHAGIIKKNCFRKIGLLPTNQGLPLDILAAATPDWEPEAPARVIVRLSLAGASGSQSIPKREQNSRFDPHRPGVRVRMAECCVQAPLGAKYW